VGITRLNGIWRFMALFSCIIALSGCSYMNYWAVQEEYARIQQAQPGQVNMKHLIDQESFYVYGVIDDNDLRYQKSSLLIAAYSDKFRKNELVDSMFMHGSNTHYGLNLPAGQFTLLVYADLDGDGVFEP